MRLETLYRVDKASEPKGDVDHLVLQRLADKLNQGKWAQTLGL